MSGVRFRLSTRAARRRPSPIRELVRFMGVDGMISFGGGYPNPATFPFARVTVELVGGGEPLVIEGDDLLAATQYGATEGLPALRDAIRRWHEAKSGVALGPDELLVLSGSQEGLYLAADALLDSGDEVALAEPTYPGALAAFRSFGARFLTVPADAEGMRVGALESALDGKALAGEPLPKLIYVIPNGDNPGGSTLSDARRRALAACARRHDIPIVEDDPYELVRFGDGDAPPTLQRLAPERVLRLDSFSKILCPGLRVGYASGPAALLRPLVLHKQASSLHTSSFAQAVLLAYLRRAGVDGFRAHIARSVALYRRNRDAMLRAARDHLAADVRWGVPDAGMFLWLTLPDGFDADRMMAEDCEDLRVLAVSGSAFTAGGALANRLRVSFSTPSPEAIDEGMQRLAVMLGRERARVAG